MEWLTCISHRSISRRTINIPLESVSLEVHPQRGKTRRSLNDSRTTHVLGSGIGTGWPAGRISHRSLPGPKIRPPPFAYSSRPVCWTRYIWLFHCTLIILTVGRSGKADASLCMIRRLISYPHLVKLSRSTTDLTVTQCSGPHRNFYAWSPDLVCMSAGPVARVWGVIGRSPQLWVAEIWKREMIGLWSRFGSSGAVYGLFILLWGGSMLL